MSDYLLYAVALPVGFIGAYYLWTKLRPVPKYRLKVPEVRFPLNLINFVDEVLRLVGVRAFSVKRAYFISKAKRIVANTDKRVFGDQEELVRGVEAFVNGVSEDVMSASGIVLLNGLLERLLSTREIATNYIQEHADEVLAAELKQPVIISGLPRTGSTMLYNLMACDPASRAPRFFEMSQMAPPVPPCPRDQQDTDPRIAKVMERFDEVEKLYPSMFTEAGKSHRSHPSELEEELLILFQTMVLQLHVPLPVTDEFRQWFESCENKAPAYRYMRVFLQMMNSCWQPESHWVLKAPMHSYNMDEVMRQFPDARIVFTHRDPLNVVPSWATLIESYLGWSFRPYALDRIKFGRYIVDSLKLMYDRVADFSRRTPSERYFNVNYEVFIKDPVAMVERIYAHFGMEVTEQFRQNMRDWIANNRQGKWGRAPYSLANYNLTKEQVLQEFAPYVQQYLQS